MTLLERSLSKLVIHAYVDRDTQQSVGSMEVMYNPSTINLQYTNEYRALEYLNKKDEVVNQFSVMKPSTLNLQLIFDAKLPGNTNNSINDQLENLKTLCCSIDPVSREPRFLRIEWGKMRWDGEGCYAGRIESLDVEYTLFDRDASPLHAVVRLGVRADKSPELQKSAQAISAPKNVVVKAPAGVSLPLLASTAAASVHLPDIDYLALAAGNQLNHLNDITPGKQLVVTSKMGGG